MPKGNTALVAVEGTTYHFDKLYGYAVPDEMEKSARPGARVVVPFGRGNKKMRGIIAQTCVGEQKGLKKLFCVLDDQPLIRPELIELAAWIKAQTFCTLYEALKLMLPAGIGLNITKVYSLNAEVPREEFERLTEDEKALCGLLGKGGMDFSRLCSQLGLKNDTAMPDDLVSRGLLVCEDAVSSVSGETTVRLVRPLINGAQAQELLNGKTLTDKQKAAFRAALAADEASVKEICYYSGVTPGVVNALAAKGAVGFFRKPLTHDPLLSLKGEIEKAEKAEKAVLSPAQEKVYGELLRLYEQKQAAAALLCGVTGSGKTQVFMKLIGRARSQGAGVIVLVPEIALTPQAVANYHSHFGRDVAVLHSGLSDGERLDEWRRIYSGGAGIVVGTRSAVFAPVKDLGLIIIDEEQEHTYKSETSPRYHARDAARYRCAKTGSLMLLASATPSVESYSAALSGRYKLLKLTERYGGAQLPRVITVDMKKELARGNDGPISSQLLGELKTNLARGEQSILLLNRRGFSTFVYCADCGRVMTCPNCSLSLTYHAANGRLMCHFCGYSADAPETCPDCGGHMRYSGRGTQRAQSALAELLPQARVLRMDTDTTSGRNSHGKLLQKFGAGKYDILLGTQMVAKGLDFPNVTLVGVLSADQSLYADDFRAAERTFSLITQVVGRSGRGSLSGRAVIQTGTPDNEVIKLASRQDYEAFFSEELSFRRSLEYPPFCDICEIGFSGADEQQVRACAQSFASRLRAELGGQKDFPSRLLGPSPASVYKADNRYRYRIILKCVNNKAARGLVSRLLCEFGGSADFRKTAVFADMDPLELL
jgi:primosomal protein N' (replication factor Y)